MGAQDMVNRFFRKVKATHHASAEHAAGTFALRAHATRDYWRWVCSWARACRQPSDMGFDNGAFELPVMRTNQHAVKASQPRGGFLFDVPAIGLQEQREDLRRTINERCEMAAALVNAHDRPAVCWTNLNAEADLLARLIPDAVNVQGSDTDEQKEDAFARFAAGDIRVMVSKPSIAGFGLNWQHCAHMTFFPSHSYEQYYQCVRRCWRFGQRRTVTVDMITTDGQENVLANMQRKAEQAATMFDMLVEMMWNELRVKNNRVAGQVEEMPKWL
jgi:hypothetical protein